MQRKVNFTAFRAYQKQPDFSYRTSSLAEQSIYYTYHGATISASIRRHIKRFITVSVGTVQEGS